MFSSDNKNNTAAASRMRFLLEWSSMECNDLICLIFPSLATFEASDEDEEGGEERVECDGGEDRFGKGAKAGK